MAKNLMILMDDSTEAEALLDHSRQLINHNLFKTSTGAFIDGISQKGLGEVFEFHSEPVLSEYAYSDLLKKIMESNPHNSNDAIERMVNKCEGMKIRIKVFFNDDEIIGKDFVNESLYNDIFVISKDTLYKNLSRDNGHEAISALLLKCKCPVLLIPADLKTVDNVVLLYDGSRQSFEAIKAFTYLMGEQLQDSNLQVLIITAAKAIADEKFLMEYIKSYKLHFSVSRIFLDNYEEDFYGVLDTFRNFLLVSGVNRREIVNDLLQGPDSFFMQEQRCVFMI